MSLMQEAFDGNNGFQLLTLESNVLDPIDEPLDEKIDSLEAQLKEKLSSLKDIDTFHQSRRAPVLETIDALTHEIQNLKEMARMASTREILPSGPTCLSCVGTWQFQWLCNAVIVGNLVVMIFQDSLPSHVASLSMNLFLTWYVLELVLKAIYYQSNLFCGPVTDVWWSYLDLLVVISGILEQWMMPFLYSEGFIQHGGHNNTLVCLRYLRLFRLIRFLKVLKIISHIEPSIVTTKEFEFFMNGIIFMNAVVMGLSLDLTWWGWFWVDQAFLLVYIIELYTRAKYWRCNFFTDPDNYHWNYLDLTIVCAGIFDQWLTPLMAVIMRFITGEPLSDIAGNGNAVQLLRFMRLFRVLRLAKLLKAIPPLHRLLVGVLRAVDSMKWVLVLTCIILYSAAIIFTTLVTKGIVEDSEGVNDENFGTVAMSIFSLFKIMNGDIDMADNLTSTLIGKLIFVFFMVLSNWAILGILTAVVSDNMIQSSIELVQKEKAMLEEQGKARNRSNLLQVFHDMDTDDSGYLDEKEWSEMLSDDGLRSIFLEAADLRERDLKHLFECLAEETYNEDGQPCKVLHYEQLLNALHSHEKLVDHRAIMRIMARMIRMEKLFLSRYDRFSKGARSSLM